MASPEWSSPVPADAEIPEPSGLDPESTRADLSKLIANVAAHYNEENAETSSDTTPQESFAWRRGGPNLFPEEESESSEGGSREDQLAREVEQLKKILETQQQATRDARTNAANLNEQLEATRAQVEKGLKQVHGGQRGRIERAESNVTQLKVEMQQAQRNLETERRARRADAAAAAARVAEAENARSFAMAAQTATKSSTPMSFRFRLGVTAAVSFVAVAAILLYWGFAPSLTGHRAAPARADISSGSAAAARTQATTSPRATRSATSQADSSKQLVAVKGAAKASDQPIDIPSGGDFTESMDRLTRALSQFPGLAPEQILRQISQNGTTSVCAFDWNNGNPALIYSGGKFSMADVLNRCAAAIEKFH